MDSAPLLELRSLVTSFRTPNGTLRAVDGVSLSLQRGRTLAVIGESGCGKSVTALSILRLLPEENSDIESGEVMFEGENLLGYTNAQMRGIRGNDISIIFQEPMTALNPVYTVGQQIMEVFRIHRGHSRREARAAAIEMLREVRISEPERRVDEYPFQMSGGMLQRVMIAMALACEPKLLIADEPTTALDVTIQAQILTLMHELQRERGTAILLITHDLGVVAETADDVAIMYGGRIVESGPATTIFGSPGHPYTIGLMHSIPTFEDHKDEPLSVIEGTVPSLEHMPSGCRFHTRCPHAEDLCRSEAPTLDPFGEEHKVACHMAHGRQEV